MSEKELGTRLVFGPAMLAVVALVYWLDETVMAERGMRGVLSAGVLGLLAVGGAHEFGAMLRQGGHAVAAGWLLLATAALCGSVFFAADLLPPLITTLVLAFAVTLVGLHPNRIAGWLPAVGATVFGAVLVAWPMYFAQVLALDHLPGVLFVVLVCKFGDIGAYLVGIAIGRHKLIPHVSPGKTWEGTLGGLALSVAVALLAGPSLLGGDRPGTLTVAGLGIVLNMTAQTGDLIESQLKRSCGVKDSSTLLPAHGGILDLIDSLLFSFPAFYVYLAVAK